MNVILCLVAAISGALAAFGMSQVISRSDKVAPVSEVEQREVA